MDEIENPPIKITPEDIAEANKLSEHCPICGSPVEHYVENPALMPVECLECSTLYHKACWEQAGGACAMIGCECKRYRPYGSQSAPTLKIGRHDIPVLLNGSRGVGRRTKRLKAQERRMYDEVHGRGLLQRFFDWLLRQIRILDE